MTKFDARLSGDFNATIHWEEGGASFWIWVQTPPGYYTVGIGKPTVASIHKRNAPPSERSIHDLDLALPTNASRAARALADVVARDALREAHAAQKRDDRAKADAYRRTIAEKMREALTGNGFTQPAADDVLFTLYQRIQAIKL